MGEDVKKVPPSEEEVQQALKVLHEDLVPSIRTMHSMVGESFVKKFLATAEVLRDAHPVAEPAHAPEKTAEEV